MAKNIFLRGRDGADRTPSRRRLVRTREVVSPSPPQGGDGHGALCQELFGKRLSGAFPELSQRLPVAGGPIAGNTRPHLLARIPPVWYCAAGMKRRGNSVPRLCKDCPIVMRSGSREVRRLCRGSILLSLPRIVALWNSGLATAR